MSTRNVITMICEGRSERVYLQGLNSFLSNSMPLSSDDSARLSFVSYLSNQGEGGARFSLLHTEYRKRKRENPKHSIEILADLDLYVRDKKQESAYQSKKEMPDFRFSVMNFEDTLALHFDDPCFEQWMSVLRGKNHFVSPLVSAAYTPLFEPIWKDQLAKWNILENTYKKGFLPVDFISCNRLRNFIRHASDQRIVELFRKSPLSSYSFAEFLSSLLLKTYPEVFDPEVFGR